MALAVEDPPSFCDFRPACCQHSRLAVLSIAKNLKMAVDDLYDR